MVKDIAAVSPINNLLVKYADEITISVPVTFAYQQTYLDRIGRFLKRAHKFGFTTKKTTILDLI